MNLSPWYWGRDGKKDSMDKLRGLIIFRYNKDRKENGGKQKRGDFIKLTNWESDFCRNLFCQNGKPLCFCI